MKIIKLFVTVILTPLFASQLQAQIHKSDLQKENFIGKVKSVVQTEKSKYSNLKREYKYNLNGNLVSEVGFENGRFSYRQELGYDAKGFLTSEKMLDSLGKLLRKTTYLNDAKGNILQATVNDFESSEKIITTYKSNPQGQVIQETKKDGTTAKLKENIIYKPDAKGTNISEHSIIYFPDYQAATDYERTPAYNSKGLLEGLYEKRTSDMTEDTQYATTTYIYNDKGSLIKSEYSETAVTNYSKRQESNSRSFDNNGNLLKESYKDEYGTKEKIYIYEFDFSGNWTKRTCFENHILSVTEARVIQYYGVEKSATSNGRSAAAAIGSSNENKNKSQDPINQSITGEEFESSPAKLILIGNQIWMAENLNVSFFRNGDTIPEARTATEWKNAGNRGEPAWSYQENDPELGKIYGKLYNWYAVNDPRGLAPAGFHVASCADWQALADTLGGMSVAGDKLKESGTTHWAAPNKNAGNEAAFTALPGGYRADDYFLAFRRDAHWWSADAESAQSAFYWRITDVFNMIHKISTEKAQGKSVRCVKN